MHGNAHGPFAYEFWPLKANIRCKAHMDECMQESHGRKKCLVRLGYTISWE